MPNGSWVSRGDRNRNARLSRLGEAVPVSNAIVPNGGQPHGPGGCLWRGVAQEGVCSARGSVACPR
jgi:hypothetical protein